MKNERFYALLGASLIVAMMIAAIVSDQSSEKYRLETERLIAGKCGEVK